MNIHTGMMALAVAAAGWPSAATADTAVATRWRLVGEAQDDCMNRAVAAIRHSGFDQGAAPGSQSISGKKGDYTASIRCVSDQRIVFFVTSGPAADTASSYLNVLYGNF